MNLEIQTKLKPDGIYITPFTAGLFGLDKLEQIESYNRKVDDVPPSMQEIMTDLSTAIYLEDTLRPIFNLSKRQHLELIDILKDLLLSEVYLGDLVPLIEDRLKEDKDRAKKMADKLVSELLAPALNEIKAQQKKYFANRIANPNLKPNLDKPKPDPVVMSQKIGGTLNLRQAPANIPSVESRPPQSTSPAPKPPEAKIPVQAAPPVQPPRPAPPPFQPTYTPKPPPPPPVQSSVPKPLAPVQPPAVRPVQPPAPRPPQPIQAPPQPPRPPQTQPQPKQFKMPPPLDGSMPIESKPPVIPPSKPEPQHNINADKVIDLRDLEKK